MSGVMDRLKAAIEAERGAANIYILLRAEQDLRRWAKAREAVDAIVAELAQ